MPWPKVFCLAAIGGHNISAGPAASANDGSLRSSIRTRAPSRSSVIRYGVARISGLAFDATGGPLQPLSHRVASRHRRDHPEPATCSFSIPQPAQSSPMFLITANGVPINIADLAGATWNKFPVWGFAHRMTGSAARAISTSSTASPESRRYSANTGHFFDSIAFATDGTVVSCLRRPWHGTDE